MNNFWNIINESRKIVLHPKLADLINHKSNIELLDYGCGDGSLITHLKNNIAISLFDINTSILCAAKEKLQEYNPIIYIDSDSIPRNHYDLVVYSLVLMEIDNKSVILSELRKMYSMLKTTGEILIAITHPCFRQHVFSTFHTSYSNDQSFNYFNEGEKFKTYINDSLPENSVSFYDFHWTLSSTIQFIIDAGFKLSEICELQDKVKDNQYVNSNFSPYIIFKAMKE